MAVGSGPWGPSRKGGGGMWMPFIIIALCQIPVCVCACALWRQVCTEAPNKSRIHRAQDCVQSPSCDLCLHMGNVCPPEGTPQETV